MKGRVETGAVSAKPSKTSKPSKLSKILKNPETIHADKALEMPGIESQYHFVPIPLWVIHEGMYAWPILESHFTPNEPLGDDLGQPPNPGLPL